MGSITHKFISDVPDGTDNSVVQPSDWNDNHEGGIVTMPDASQTIAAQNGDVSPLILKGAPSQEAPFVEIQDVFGNMLLKVVPNGNDADLAMGVATPLAQIHTYRNFTATPDTDEVNVGIMAQVAAKGSRSVSHQNHAFRAYIIDGDGVVNKTVSNATNNGSGLIRITTSTAHTMSTDDYIVVYGVGGVTNANGGWKITVINSTQFDLVGSTFAGTYTSGGTATNRPYLAAFSASVGPALDRGGMTGTGQNADDVVGVAVSNIGAGVGTDAFYIANLGSWFSGFTSDVDADRAFATGINDLVYGLYLAEANISGAAVYIPNNSWIAARNAAGSLQNLVKLNASDHFEFGATVTAIPFAATQSASADPNTLDDYEEGTWTPVLTFATAGNLSVVYTSQAGFYTKIGNIVVFGFIITTSTFTHTTASGNLQVTGLPFAVDATHAGRITAIIQGYTKANFTQTSAVASQGGTTLTFPAGGSGQTITALAAADMPTGGTVSIRGGGFYRV